MAVETGRDSSPDLPPERSGEAIYAQHEEVASNPEPNGHYVAYRVRQAGYLSWLSGAFGYTFGVGGFGAGGSAE